MKRSSFVVAFVVAVFFAVSATNLVFQPQPEPRPDEDDCSIVRIEAFIRDCDSVTLSSNGHGILKAVCADPYTGAEAEDRPNNAYDVDQIFPQDIARNRRMWPRLATADGRQPTLTEFGESPENLVVVLSSTRHRKGNLMPHQWCPGDPNMRPVMAIKFRALAWAYGLPLFPEEELGLRFWDARACARGAIVIGK